MTRLREIVTAGVLLLCFVTVSYGGTITGSKTGVTGSKVGTITGSRTGTITGSRIGTITGSRKGTITGSAVESSKTAVENIYDEFFLQLLRVVLNGGL